MYGTMLVVLLVVLLCSSTGSVYYRTQGKRQLFLIVQNIKDIILYLHFPSYLNTYIAQVVEILPHGWCGPVHPSLQSILDSKAHGANMGPTWVLSAPDGPHVGPMNLAIGDILLCLHSTIVHVWMHVMICVEANFPPASLRICPLPSWACVNMYIENIIKSYLCSQYCACWCPSTISC